MIPFWLFAHKGGCRKGSQKDEGSANLRRSARTTKGQGSNPFELPH